LNYGDGTSDQFILNFGDGAPSFNSSTSHTYTAAGTYTATLTVFYTNLASASDTITITVSAASSLPAAPSNLTAMALSKSQINLTWTNNSANQDGVKIERCKGSSCTNFTQITTVAGTATTFTDSGLAANTAYRYRVRAYNSAGDSPYSNIAGAKTLRR
jgi:PKD repeat protein